MPNISLIAIAVITLAASVPTIRLFVLLARSKSEEKKSPSNASWIVMVAVSALFAGVGHVVAAGLAANQALTEIWDLQAIVLSFSVGFLIVGGGVLHFSLVERILKSERRSYSLILGDPLNAGLGGAISLIAAATVWYFV